MKIKRVLSTSTHPLALSENTFFPYFTSVTYLKKRYGRERKRRRRTGSRRRDNDDKEKKGKEIFQRPSEKETRTS